ncbi:MAG: tetraacyldisaccharide 4'-kinase [bacterium]|nr:tetraacyldisaccharide 4'-kinase [bacterium]
MSFRGTILSALDGDPAAPIWSRLLSGGLAPAGWAYGKAMRLRRQSHQPGGEKPFHFERPVVSVGNLVLGGTGKTPTVAWIARFLRERGFRPAIVSRGYGGSLKEVAAVGDGKGKVMDSPPAGDEAAMLARSFPDMPVITGRNRLAAARRAVAAFGADVIVLDDGFQHLRLERSVDIVLLRGQRPFGNGRVFPAGVLREPAAALSAADVVLLTGEVDGQGRREVEKRVPSEKIFEGRLVPGSLLEGGRAESQGVELLRGAVVVAFCGIGHPNRFRKMLSALGADVREFFVFPDHAAYQRSHTDIIAASFRERGADFIVTTGKDGVKAASLLSGLPLRVLSVEMEIDRPAEFQERILEKISRAPSRSS